MTMGKLMLLGLGIGLAVLVVIELPEIQRYIKMETM